MKLSKILLAGTFIAGVSGPGLAADLADVSVQAPPPVQDSRTSGYVEIYTGYSSLDPWSGGDYDGALIGGAGRANIWLTQMVSFQIDAGGEAVFWDLNNDDDYTYGAFGIGGHLAWRDPNRFAFGGLVSFGAGNFDQGGGFMNLALEGQAYFNNFTVYGQAGWVNGIHGAGNDSDYDIDGGYLFGQLRYFAMPNLMIAGNLGWTSLDGGCGCGDFEAFSYGAEVEWQPNGNPWSVFASLQGAQGDWFDEDVDEWTVTIGGKILMGKDSLQAMNDSGATFVDANPVYGKYRVRSFILED